MVILGIDPGYATLGYGIIEFKNAKYAPVHYGAIITSPKNTFSERLEIIFESLALFGVFEPCRNLLLRFLPAGEYTRI